MFENVREDVKAHEVPGNILKKAIYLLFKQELHAVLIYRLGRWAAFKCKTPVVRRILIIIYFFLSKLSEMLIGAWIEPKSDIGPGLKIEHAGSIIVGVKKMGKNCRISSQVIIGFIGGFKGGGLPTIGDNVFVGAGAKIMGDIKIGNNVLIGANAVVITDVPDDSVAIGVPAKIRARKKNSYENPVLKSAEYWSQQ